MQSGDVEWGSPPMNSACHADDVKSQIEAMFSQRLKRRNPNSPQRHSLSPLDTPLEDWCTLTPLFPALSAYQGPFQPIIHVHCAFVSCALSNNIPLILLMNVVGET